MEIACILITFHVPIVYLILGHYYEHVGLMVSLQRRGILSKGDYFVVGIDIEQYDPAKPEKYLRGLLLEDVEPLAVQAFQSYLGIVPTASVSFATFANEVCPLTGPDSDVIDALHPPSARLIIVGPFATLTTHSDPHSVLVFRSTNTWSDRHSISPIRWVPSAE